MTAPIAFIDCETTSLRPDRRAWEIALIAGSFEHRFLIHHADLDLGNADLFSLKIGRFYERHPVASGDMSVTVWSEDLALAEVERLTRGAVLHGSNPSFDAETLAARMRAHGICPSWHYHTKDVTDMAHGWLIGRGLPVPTRDDGTVKSDDLSAACGVDPAGYDRHTALGDCRWMRDLFDVVTGAREVQG